ncbi:hypothetical protein GCM10009122_57600 [Fulvivirga kasyanovii]|uniref:Type II toxin-antitoxin system RelE/ParE family toxin n=1 Tax=Fulvivirga kasyanovii TaxID=396812 RepID=A0ABW9RKN6_9BACT|nr:hypothetical protein [Fulvivirga kasyanovii]MTI23929.1 hypothetical protein [Fulvivirga kasyanovii]
MNKEILNQPQLQLMHSSIQAMQIIRIFEALKPISFSTPAMQKLEEHAGSLDRDILYFQHGRQLFFCSKRQNRLIAKIDFQR